MATKPRNVPNARAGQKRGRPPGIPASEHTRAKISTTKIVKRLERFLFSNQFGHKPAVALTDGQVRAAVALLKKVLPDLSAATIDGNLELGGDLFAAIEAGRKRARS